jgi:hypothetical protein
MACVTVWAIAADKRKEGTALRVFLIKLSGRQMRQKKNLSTLKIFTPLTLRFQDFQRMNVMWQINNLF